MLLAAALEPRKHICEVEQIGAGLVQQAPSPRLAMDMRHQLR